MRASRQRNGFRQAGLYPAASRLAGGLEVVWGRSWLTVSLLAVGLLAGCDGGHSGITRLSPRGVPYLDGVPVPSNFKLVDKLTEDYESGGQRTARHAYSGHADPHAVRRFYREQMPMVGWTRVSDQNVKGTITIRFEKKNETCTVEIQAVDMFNRCAIQVIVMPFSRTPPSEPPKRPVP